MRMTRPAPQPACARVRQLVAVWLGCVLWCSAGAVARAQVRAELERALTVTRELPGCVSAPALRARTAQYLGRAEQLTQLTIEVDLQVPLFRVLRDGTLLAERRFARAPTDCSERRDALALAVAIAIEQVTEDPRSPTGLAADSDEPAAAAERSTAQPSAAERGAGDSERIFAAPDKGQSRAPTQPARPSGEQSELPRAVAGEPVQPLSAADRGQDRARDVTTSGRPRALVSVLGGGALMFEALPTAAPAFAVGAELALLPALRIGLSGLFSTAVSSAFQGGVVSTQLYGAQLTGCVNAPIFASLLVLGCLGAVGGVVDAHGDRFAQNLSDRMGWLAGLVRARLEFPVAGRLAAGVYADARVNLLRPELQASLATQPVRTRAVGLLGAALGVELIVRLH